MSKVVWKGSTLLAPLPPALVSCGTMENPNVFTVGWTGIINSQPPKSYISVRPERYSYELIKKTGEFVINLPTQALCRAVDFCGVRSGRDMDKFKKCGLTPIQASEVSAPLVEQSPLSLECRVFDVIKLGTHDMFMCDILAIDVDEDLIDEKGKLHLGKSKLIAYSHGDYLALGKKLGSFGFSVRKKRKTNNR